MGRYFSFICFIFIIITVGCTKKINVDFPSVLTIDLTNISDSSVTCFGKTNVEGISPKIEKGFCWSHVEDPKVEDNKLIVSTGNGIYKGVISGLFPGTIYYIRAYVKSSTGTFYGNQLVAITDSIAPKIKISKIQESFVKKIIFKVEVVSTGGSEINDKGILWDTVSNPKSYHNTKSFGKGAESFICILDSLKPNTKYYIKAYARNSVDVSSSQEFQIGTMDTLPEVTTKRPFQITSKSIYCGGEIINLGSKLLKAGIIWDTASITNLTKNKIYIENITKDYIIKIDNLLPGKKYYIKAFAENSAGLVYGNEQSAMTDNKIWIKGNTHSHTTLSDGSLDPLTVSKLYKTKGYQFLFITDHNYITSIDGLSSSDFICISGEEISFNKHIICLGINNLIITNSSQFSIDNALNMRGIPIFCHPIYKPTRTYYKEIESLINLKHIEIYNGLCESYGYNDDHKLWDSLLTNRKYIFGIACDDSHSISSIDKGWIMVKVTSLQKDSILNAINNGDFYSSTGIYFSNIETSPSSILIETQNATIIKFIGNNGNILKVINDKRGEYQIKGTENYIRVEASDHQGKKAWTQPLIWK